MVRESGVDEITILGQLEALAQGLGIEVRYESMEGEAILSPGGLCRIKGRQVIIVNERVPVGDKVGTLVKAFRRFDLSRIYLRPVLRDLLERDVE